MKANDTEESCMVPATSIKSNENIPPKNIDTDIKNAYEYIYSIDFSMIINKLVERHKWLRIESEDACKKYRNYLWLLKKYGTEKPLPPSEDIDEFWHHHILDTNKYIRDCVNIFGKYFHHYPYYGVDGKTTMTDLYDSFERTQKLYQGEFDCPITAIRFYGSIKILMKILVYTESFFKWLKPRKRGIK